MKFVFTDKKINLPNKVHAYAEKKVGKLDRYFKADAEAAIVFSVEKGRNNVELTIRSGGTIIRVAESTSDMFATIDAALEESTGIGVVEQGGALAARVTPAGIVVTSPKGAARATVYGLDGRAVLTQEAADGETIGTGQLPAGTYVLYLRCGSEARVVKFVK